MARTPAHPFYCEARPRSIFTRSRYQPPVNQLQALAVLPATHEYRRPLIHIPFNRPSRPRKFRCIARLPVVSHDGLQIARSRFP